ncbi:MAG TPA: class I SAM-dependent methyltransferase [Candidatus Acidoferrum sp.]|nr:class I SAM-dependent methyltransferase [Candidatus Acidoferrum sp.]
MPDGPGRESEAAALARLYDLDLTEDPGDLDLYHAFARRTGGPILELGVGSGRIAVPLAAAGHDVTGIDIEPAMLARARKRAMAAGDATAGRLRLLGGDAREIRLPDAGRYRLAFVALNSILIMGDRVAQAAVVKTLADHLTPGGLAVVDVWLPDADDLARYDGRVILEYPRRDPESGHFVTKVGSALHDPASGTFQLTTIYEEGDPGTPAVRWIRQDRMRLVSPDDLRSFAESAGLEVETIAGGYDLEPLGPGADRAIMVAVRR